MILTKSILYLEVRKGLIKATELKSGRTTTKISKALTHPRSLMGDFFGVTKCIESIVKELSPKKFLSGPTTIIIHLLENGDGGFSNVETRAFKEAALSAGGQRVKFPNKPIVLNKDELLSGNFSCLDNI